MLWPLMHNWQWLELRYVYVFVHSSVFVHLGMELGSCEQCPVDPLVVDDFAEKSRVEANGSCKGLATGFFVPLKTSNKPRLPTPNTSDTISKIPSVFPLWPWFNYRLEQPKGKLNVLKTKWGGGWRSDPFAKLAARPTWPKHGNWAMKHLSWRCWPVNLWF